MTLKFPFEDRWWRAQLVSLPLDLAPPPQLQMCKVERGSHFDVCCEMSHQSARKKTQGPLCGHIPRQFLFVSSSSPIVLEIGVLPPPECASLPQ